MGSVFYEVLAFKSLLITVYVLLYLLYMHIFKYVCVCCLYTMYILNSVLIHLNSLNYRITHVCYSTTEKVAVVMVTNSNKHHHEAPFFSCYLTCHDDVCNFQVSGLNKNYSTPCFFAVTAGEVMN